MFKGVTRNGNPDSYLHFLFVRLSDLDLGEAGGDTLSQAQMRTATRLYIGLVGLGAFIAMTVLYRWRPEIAQAQVIAIFVLSALAFVAELLAYALSQSG